MPGTDTPTVSRASNRTALRLGEVSTNIGLFKVTTDPAARKWERPPEESAPGSPAAAAPKGDPISGKRATPSSGSTGKSAAAEKPAPRPKGIMKGDGAFVDLTEQIAEIAERTTLDSMEVISFINRSSVPRERITNAYYVGAGSGGDYPASQVIARLYRGLKESGRAAVVRWGQRTRSYVGVLVAHRSGALMALELAYAENVLGPNPDSLSHQHVEVSDEQLGTMVALIEAMSARRDSLDDIRDHRAVLEDELVTRAEHGELDDFTATKAVPDEEVAELGEALKKSLEAVAA